MERSLWPRRQPRLLMKPRKGEGKAGPISQSHKSSGKTQWVRSAVNRKKHWHSSSALTHRRPQLAGEERVRRLWLESIPVSDKNRRLQVWVAKKKSKKKKELCHIPSARRPFNDPRAAENVPFSPIQRLKFARNDLFCREQAFLIQPLESPKSMCTVVRPSHLRFKRLKLTPHHSVKTNSDTF